MHTIKRTCKQCNAMKKIAQNPHKCFDATKQSISAAGNAASECSKPAAASAKHYAKYPAGKRAKGSTIFHHESN